ncbi:MAG: hypothetical protein ACO1OB_18435 [Archangium sp.]
MNRMVVMMTVLTAGAVFACRPSTVLPGEQVLSASNPPPKLDDSGTDTVSPAKVVIDRVTVKANAGACANIDVMTILVTASDDRTAAGSLRYAASFGATAEEASAADATLLFDTTTATSIDLPLIGDGGSLFTGTPRCFTLSAVDGAANVGPKSDATCVDTSMPTSGCSSAPVLWLALSALLLRRGR